jgi:hypothetical protein
LNRPDRGGFAVPISTNVQAEFPQGQRDYGQPDPYRANRSCCGSSLQTSRWLPNRPDWGPPCQGFSRTNTAASCKDQRNELPDLYVAIVEQLQKYYQVEFVVFENVLGMRDRKHANAYKKLIDGLQRLELDVIEKELCALDLGVPQNRTRIVLSGLRKGRRHSVRPRRKKGHTSVSQAISGIPAPVFYSPNLAPESILYHPNHWTMNPKSMRFRSNSNNYRGRSFKRLSWIDPSPTIAFGHREIYVHPDGNRRLSIFEAMLLQGFPRQFVLEGNLSEQVDQVSNAVPPPLARRPVACSASKRLSTGLGRSTTHAGAGPVMPRGSWPRGPEARIDRRAACACPRQSQPCSAQQCAAGVRRGSGCR